MRLEFTDQELAVLSKALSQMPYGEVAPLIANLNKQIETEQKEAQ